MSLNAEPPSGIRVFDGLLLFPCDAEVVGEAREGRASTRARGLAKGVCDVARRDGCNPVPRNTRELPGHVLYADVLDEL
jgi:hypothetical protein